MASRKQPVKRKVLRQEGEEGDITVSEGHTSMRIVERCFCDSVEYGS